MSSKSVRKHQSLFVEGGSIVVNIHKDLLNFTICCF